MDFFQEYYQSDAKFSVNIRLHVAVFFFYNLCVSLEELHKLFYIIVTIFS